MAKPCAPTAASSDWRRAAAGSGILWRNISHQGQRMAGHTQQSHPGVRSPCVSLCRIDDETQQCRGCRRTRAVQGLAQLFRTN
ncbi:DUF1289 domain-containing protein [Serratia marcescens]|uniref:DUF1289 domain-containing protein n=1 Tax=Serratia marcescens TaxID=615 RepID=UPI003D2A27FC